MNFKEYVLYYVGKPTINKFLFYSGKTAFGITILFPLLKISGCSCSFTGESYFIPALIFFIPGTVILILAFINLGGSLRVGLPKESTKLKTEGIYRISRNPIYLGVHFYSLASVLICPHPLNIIFFIISLSIHHKIILAEEIFLAGRFGKEWTDYKKRVRRYL